MLWTWIIPSPVAAPERVVCRRSRPQVRSVERRQRGCYFNVCGRISATSNKFNIGEMIGQTYIWRGLSSRCIFCLYSVNGGLFPSLGMNKLIHWNMIIDRHVVWRGEGHWVHQDIQVIQFFLIFFIFLLVCPRSCVISRGWWIRRTS